MSTRTLPALAWLASACAPGPAGWEPVAALALPGAFDVSRDGDLAAVALADGPAPSVALIDLADAERTQVIAVITDAGGVVDVELGGGLLVVANQGPGHSAALYDVSVPAAPRLLSRVDDQRITPGGVGVHDAALAGGWLHLASQYTEAWYIIDVRDPEAPRLVAEVEPPRVDGPRGSAHTIVIAGGRAYVAWSAAGCGVYDLADPGAPVLIAHLRPPDANCVHLAPAGDLVVASADQGDVGLHLFELAGTAAAAVGHLAVPSALVHQAEAAEDQLLAAYNSAGLAAWTLDGAAPPQLDYRYDTNPLLGPFPGGAVALHAAGSQVLVADTEAGLIVFERD